MQGECVCCTSDDASCHLVVGVASDPAGLAEAVPPSAAAYKAIAPPVQTIAEGTPYAVPAAKSTSGGYAPTCPCMQIQQNFCKIKH